MRNQLLLHDKPKNVCVGGYCFWISSENHSMIGRKITIRVEASFYKGLLTWQTRRRQQRCTVSTHTHCRLFAACEKRFFRHLCNILKLSLQVKEIKDLFLRSKVMELRNISVATIDSFQVSKYLVRSDHSEAISYGLFSIWRQASLACQHKPVAHNWLK